MLKVEVIKERLSHCALHITSGAANHENLTPNQIYAKGVLDGVTDVLTAFAFAPDLLALTLQPHLPSEIDEKCMPAILSLGLEALKPSEKPTALPT